MIDGIRIAGNFQDSILHELAEIFGNRAALDDPANSRIYSGSFTVHLTPKSKDKIQISAATLKDGSKQSGESVRLFRENPGVKLDHCARTVNSAKTFQNKHGWVGGASEGDRAIVSKVHAYPHGVKRFTQARLEEWIRRMPPGCKVSTARKLREEVGLLQADVQTACESPSASANLAAGRVETSLFITISPEFSAFARKYAEARGFEIKFEADRLRLKPGHFMYLLLKISAEAVRKCASSGAGPAAFVPVEDFFSLGAAIIDAADASGAFNGDDHRTATASAQRAAIEISREFGFDPSLTIPWCREMAAALNQRCALDPVSGRSVDFSEGKTPYHCAVLPTPLKAVEVKLRDLQREWVLAEELSDTSVAKHLLGRHASIKYVGKLDSRCNSSSCYILRFNVPALRRHRHFHHLNHFHRNHKLPTTN